MATDGQNTSDHTAKRLTLILRILALIWTGLAALILASLVIFYWQSPATPLGLRLVQFLFYALAPWLLLLLCVLGLSVSLLVGRRTQSGGRVWPVLTGSLAVAIAIVAILIVVAAICSQQSDQDACLQVFFAASHIPLCVLCLPGVCTVGVLTLLPPFLAAVAILAGCWVAKRVPARDGEP